MENIKESFTISAQKSQELGMKNDLENLSSTYQNALMKDIERIDNIQEHLNLEINQIYQLISELELLSEQPEWPDSYIQINPLAYTSATITHTGEHYIQLGSEMFTLMSFKETHNYLLRKINKIEKLLDSYKTEKQQLEERFKIITDSISETTHETEGMPAEITSEKGTAHKTNSGFYEIIEPYDEAEEKAFYKKRQELKLKKKDKYKQERDVYFEILNDLEENENLKQEMSDVDNNFRNDISKRVKSILKSSDLYKNLIADTTIKSYCDKLTNYAEDSGQNDMLPEQLLNELLIKSLSIEPDTYSTTNEINVDFQIKQIFSSIE